MTITSTFLTQLRLRLDDVDEHSAAEGLDHPGDVGADGAVGELRRLVSQEADERLHVGSELLVADEVVDIGLETRSTTVKN